MKKATFYIGLNDKDTKFQEIETITAGKIVNRILSGIFTGATVSNARGVFTHADGVQVIEETIRAEVFDPAESKIREAVKELKKELNQESIAVEVQSVDVRFM